MKRSIINLCLVRSSFSLVAPPAVLAAARSLAAPRANLVIRRNEGKSPLAPRTGEEVARAATLARPAFQARKSLLRSGMKV